jgi:hypothetical protein
VNGGRFLYVLNVKRDTVRINSQMMQCSIPMVHGVTGEQPSDDGDRPA